MVSKEIIKSNIFVLGMFAPTVAQAFVSIDVYEYVCFVAFVVAYFRQQK